MNEYKETYIQKKDKVMECLDKAEQFLSENGYSEEANVVQTQKENLWKGEFSIAVVGEFSAGKSTFLNALMGEKLLPSFTKETTATINFLRHSDKAENGEAGRVYYNNGDKKVLEKADAETISRYVSTNSSENVAQNINRLDLYLDSKFLEGNVTLVDTPGLNGVAEGHKEITQQQIERSSAGIFMFNANQPGSKTDFEFLADLRKHVQNVFLVLNQIDCIKETEGETVESVVQVLKENYKKNVDNANGVPEIIPVAAYLSLVAKSKKKLDYQGKTEFSSEEKAELERRSRMKEFEDRLWRYLTQGEKAKTELLAPLDQLNAKLGDIKTSLNNEKEVLSGKIDQNELQKQMLELNKAREELETQLAEKTSTMKSEVRKAERDFLESIEAGSDGLTEKMMRNVDNFEDLDDIDPQSIQNRIQKGLENIAKDAYSSYCDGIREVMIFQANTVSDEINDTLNTSLNIKVNKKLELPEYEVGIEEFMKRENQLKAEYEALERQAEESINDVENQIDISNKRDAIEKKLEECKEARNAYEQNSFALAPAVEKSMQKQNIEQDRGGVIGKIQKFFVGKKTVTIDVEVINDSERKEYMENRSKIVNRYDSEMEKYEKQLSETPSANVAEKKRIAAMKERARKAKEAELKAFQDNMKEKIQRQCASQLRKQKSNIRDYIEEIADDMKKETRNKFKERRDGLMNAMNELVAGSVRKQIELKQQEIELLQKNMEKDAADRNARLEVIERRLLYITNLLRESFALRDDIDSVETDHIKEEVV